MSIGKEIPYRRSARANDATGSLVFDQERKRVVSDEPDKVKKPTLRRITENFPG
jgi:hypothetical protein